MAVDTKTLEENLKWAIEEMNGAIKALQTCPEDQKKVFKDRISYYAGQRDVLNWILYRTPAPADHLDYVWSD